ncbi:MAG: NAD(P)-dependent oxidoreductase [Polyangiaceae bacterium]|nr:NAD(P)-dependent oxidoreductase [Polyangiaceae bacterium]
MKQKVIVDPHGRRMEDVFSDADRERLYSIADVVWGKNEPMPDAEIAKVAKEVVAVVSGRWRHGDFSRFPKLTAFLEVGGGHPSPADFDYKTCFERSIRVLSCAPAFGPTVAEMALGLALACARDIAWTDGGFRAADREANWSHTDLNDSFTLFDKPVGFIGFGSLARSLKPLVEPFRGPIQVYDPWLTDTYLRTQGVTPVDLDTLLKTSRFIYVLAVPTSANKHFLNREKLEMIRPDAVLLLMSRASVVDFDALTDLLVKKRFRAGIDVFPVEPLDRDHPIRKLPNVVLSSHRAGAIREGIQNIGHLVVNDLEAIVAGKVPQQMQVAQPEFIRLRGD